MLILNRIIIIIISELVKMNKKNDRDQKILEEFKQQENKKTGENIQKMQFSKIDPTKLTNPHVICANGNIYTLLSCLGVGQFG